VPPFVGVGILCPGIVRSQLHDAARNRPERFGGAGHKERAEPTYFEMDPLEVGRRVVAGVRQGDFYILNHPPVRDWVDERHDEIVEAFER
jgi:hypothetical protein